MRRARARRSPRQKSNQSKPPLPFAAPVELAEEKPVRGVKLRTVSAFTMFVAVLCLLAFMAGRPDTAATSRPPATPKVHDAPARTAAPNAERSKAPDGPAMRVLQECQPACVPQRLKPF